MKLYVRIGALTVLVCLLCLLASFAAKKLFGVSSPFFLCLFAVLYANWLKNKYAGYASTVLCVAAITASSFFPAIALIQQDKTTIVYSAFFLLFGILLTNFINQLINTQHVT